MKTMTCKQMGGACDETFSAETFEEMAELSKQHGMEMFQKGDEAHLKIMGVQHRYTAWQIVRKMFAGILIITLALVIGIAWYLFPSANKVLAAIEKHPQSASFYLRLNDESAATLNPDVLTPLASTLKIIIAIEYAEQAAAGELDPDMLVPLSELDKFYVAKTDGGAHGAFLKNYADKTHDNAISLRRVAKGMIAFSSNANTDYLIQLLGVDRINQRIELLGVKEHSTIYPLVASMFVADELVADTGTKQSIATRVRQLSDTEYLSWLVHSGQKGGSTATLLTKALYATLKDGNSIELVYFLKDLKVYSMLRLSISMNAFEHKMLNNKHFREEVIERIARLEP